MRIKRWGLSGNQLKIIAIIAMTIDRLTSVILPAYDMHLYTLVLYLIG